MPRDDTRGGTRSIPTREQGIQRGLRSFWGGSDLGVGLREKEFQPSGRVRGGLRPSTSHGRGDLHFLRFEFLTPPPPPHPDAQPEQITRQSQEATERRSMAAEQDNRPTNRTSRAHRAKGAAESKQNPSRPSTTDPDS